MTVDPIGRFAKRGQDEDFLAHLNALLVASHDAELVEIDSAPPSLHIVGAPRSGTTLLTQLTAAHLDVGYIDHIAASLWRAPLYGLRLSAKLLNGRRNVSYRSHFGRTEDISEPHEFGYFWRDVLGYTSMTQGEVADDAIDWPRLRITLRSMTTEVERPLAFKSFLLGLHLARAVFKIPETCFVWVRRPIVETAVSILRFREEFAGSRDMWVSLRPANYSELSRLSNAEQAVGQAVAIENHIADQFAQVATRNVLEVELAQLCEQPGIVLEAIAELLGRHGTPVALTSVPTADLLSHRRDGHDDPDLAEIEMAVRRLDLT